MQIEKIFGEIPIFQDIKMDKILFESSYPILFTCIENRNIYLFICCVNNSDETKWIGTKTSYPNLIELLTNEITIRDAFANVTDKKFLITKKVCRVNFYEVDFEDLPQDLLPMAGEFLETESGEFEEEILCFEERMESEKMDKEANKKKKYSSLKERIEEYYGKPFEEVCAERDCFREEMKEIDFGGSVGEEYW